MEPIKRSLQDVLARSPRLRAQMNELKEEIKHDEKIVQFLQEHQLTIEDPVVDRNIAKLYEFTQASHQCDRCPSLEGCINVVAGLQPELTLKNGAVELKYSKCPSRIKNEQERELQRMISSMYMPKDVLKAQLSHIDMFFDDSRVFVVQRAKQFLNEYDKTGKLPKKGLYIHGPFGVGKSFIIGALANELANRHIQTVIVYLPEFFREMKQSIQNQSLEPKLDFVKKAPVLMLDDIGAESMSAWVRDDILGTILQYRMSEQLPTFFTSNFNMNELAYHLTYTQRGEKEEVKAGRIMERIREVSEPIELKGKNMRNQS
ncbi:primosomal protein DnaI [Savagea faecisuis]|uniref:Primosomal protein DnaI n=1 Tax=Savagea faecisuis TaxID=1274803 RepID=A0ABW3H3Q8_9BACL